MSSSNSGGQTRLFHGTSEDAARSICSSHFRLPSSSSHGDMFGKVGTHEVNLKVIEISAANEYCISVQVVGLAMFGSVTPLLFLSKL